MTNVEALREFVSVAIGISEDEVKGETIAEVLHFAAILVKASQGGGGKDEEPVELGELAITSQMGSTEGFTNLTVTPSLSLGNTYKYKTAPSGLSLPDYKADLSDWLTWDGTSDIEGEDGHEICVCEVNSSNEARKGGIATIHSI